jgi:hypothetical protein
MSADELRHVAMPKLFGAPPYARPSVPVIKIERPFDPDDLPIQAVMTDEERELLENGPALHVVAEPVDSGRSSRLFSLRVLTSRLRGTSG